MGSRIIVYISILVLTLLLTIIGASAQSVELNPSTSTPTVNTTFTVDVQLNNIGSIIGFNANVSTSGNLEYQGVVSYPDGWILLTDNPIRVFTLNDADAVNTTNGASIVTLQFKALSPGNATITLSNITAKDVNDTSLTIGNITISITIVEKLWMLYDMDHDGKISKDELIDAFDDWMSGKITINDFINIFDKWMTS